jgi:hypothetical protein
MLTAPARAPSVKLAECSTDRDGHIDRELAEDGHCDPGYDRDRTAGWLYADAQPLTVPVYRCSNEALHTHFASNASDCDGLGRTEHLLGYGLAP